MVSSAYSQITTGGSGNWSSTSVNLPWAGGAVPTAGQTVTINNTHIVTLDVNTAVTLASITINPGGTLITTGINSIDANTITVNGVYTNGSSGAVTVTNWIAGPGATYNHTYDGGSIPFASTTRMWNATSNVFITGIINATTIGGFEQTFGNVTWNSASQDSNCYLEANATIQGDFDVFSTGSLDPTNHALRMSNTATGYTVTVLGDLFVNANATFKMNNSTGSCTLDIANNLTIDGVFMAVTGAAPSTVTVGGNVVIGTGTLNLTEDGSAAIGTLNIAGNFSNTAGTLTETGGGTGSIVFNGGTTQTFTSGGTFANTINYTVNSGTTLQMAAAGTVVSSDGDFTLSAGATLGVTSPVGITTGGATGNIQVSGSRTYSSGANYLYNGAGNQASGNGLSQNTPANIEINNPGNTVSLSTPINLTGNLSVSAGSLDTNGQKVTFSGGGVQSIIGVAASQTFDDLEVNKIGGSVSAGGSITALSLTNFIQTQGNFSAPATLTTSGGFTQNAGTYTAGTNTNVAGNFTRNGGTFLAGGGTVTFNGTGLQILGGSTGTTFNNVVTANSTNTTVTVATTVGANLTVVDGTTFTVSTGNFSVDGSTIIGTGVSGTLSISSAAGSKVFTGLVLINSGATWNNGSNAPVEFRGGITSSGLFTAGTGLQTFSTNPQGLSGTFSIPNVTTDIALTNSNSLFVSSSLSGSGDLIQGAGATLDLGGSFGITTITTTNAGNTVIYSGNSQAIKAISYENLTINQTSGEASLSGATIVNNVLDLSARNLNLSGNNLTLEATATISVAAPSAAKMIIAGGGGEVRKIFTVDGSFIFPIGDNTGMLEYSPVTVNVTGSGYGGGAYIGASVTDSKHPDNASGTHFITRYWELSQSGITGPMATVTASYLPSDINGVQANTGSAYLDGTFDQVSNPWVKSGEVLGANTLTYTGASLGSGVNTFTGITTADPSITIDNGATVAVCQDATVTLNTTLTGGDGAVSYSWGPVTDLSSSTDPDPVYTGTTPGGPYTYTVTVTDANGITASDNIDISVTASPTADAGAATAETCETTSYTVAGASVTNSSGIL
ncbi:MAG: PKD domain-containing protein, partial [Cyclobacteriaceae bacterium]